MTKNNVFRSNSLRRHTMKSKNFYKRMKRFAKNSTNDFKKFYRRFISFVSFQISLANSLMKNFYIQTIIKSRKSLFNIWNIKKMFVDSNFTLNFIFERIFHAMNEIIYSKKFMTMIIANGDRIRFSKYIRLKIVTTEVNRVIQIWIVSKETIYSMILKRSWLKSVIAIDLYEFDEYWIKNAIAKNYKKMKMFDSRKKNRKKIYEVEMNVALTQNVDVETLIDLKYEKKKKTEEIFRQIVKKAEKKMWNEKTNLMMKIDLKENANQKKIMLFSRHWDVERAKKITQQYHIKSKKMTSTSKWKTTMCDRKTKNREKDLLKRFRKWKLMKLHT